MSKIDVEMGLLIVALAKQGRSDRAIVAALGPGAPSRATVARYLLSIRGHVRAGKGLKGRSAAWLAPPASPEPASPEDTDRLAAVLQVNADVRAAGLTGDPALAVRVAVARVSAGNPWLADALAHHPVHEVIAGMHGDSPHAAAIEVMGSPAGLAWIALGATVDEFTGRESGQSEASYTAFLRTVRPAHIARAKALLRATVGALATVYTESFDDYPGASDPKDREP